MESQLSEEELDAEEQKRLLFFVVGGEQFVIDVEAVEEIVVQLNERRLGKRGRVHLVMTPKKKPPA